MTIWQLQQHRAHIVGTYSWSLLIGTFGSHTWAHKSQRRRMVTSFSSHSVSPWGWRQIWKSQIVISWIHNINESKDTCTSVIPRSNYNTFKTLLIIGDEFQMWKFALDILCVKTFLDQGTIRKYKIPSSKSCVFALSLNPRTVCNSEISLPKLDVFTISLDLRLGCKSEGARTNAYIINVLLDTRTICNIDNPKSEIKSLYIWQLKNRNPICSKHVSIRGYPVTLQILYKHRMCSHYPWIQFLYIWKSKIEFAHRQSTLGSNVGT